MTLHLRWTRSGREIRIQAIPWVSQYLSGSSFWDRAVWSYYVTLYHIFMNNSLASTIITSCLGTNCYSRQALRAQAMLHHLWGNGEQCCMAENSAVIKDHGNDQPTYEIWSSYSICNELENGKKDPYNIKKYTLRKVMTFWLGSGPLQILCGFFLPLKTPVVLW